MNMIGHLRCNDCGARCTAILYQDKIVAYESVEENQILDWDGGSEEMQACTHADYDVVYKEREQPRETW